MPVGITASGKDQLVPPESVVRLGQVLQAMRRPVLINFHPDGGHETNYEDATQILEFVIERSEK
jgi:predicted esterase